ncbi:hypothetical protein LSM04_002621 [Trypanosoma melophagium]|uniref:uncharacterized protein n=1 Tax=Trypanosoma melophagium TaxID=715481 RepID=UPI00351A7314|nr:hypothetical protein LSM04_002621 [Trypanosoma melophagium]
MYQPLGPVYHPQNFGMYGPPQDEFGYQFAPDEMPLYNPPGYDMYAQGPPLSSRGSRGPGMSLQRKKSMCGPMSEEDREAIVSRCARNPSRAGETSSGRLSRRGSVYDKGSRCGSLSRGLSCRDIVQEVHQSNKEEREELKAYYGNMAGREEKFEYRGARAIGSYRDVDGKDVAQPRRVQRRGKTGYGGVTSHREAVMRSGGRWGSMELSRRPRSMPEPEPEEMEVWIPPEPVIMPEPVQVMSQIDMSIYDDGDVFKDHGI